MSLPRQNTDANETHGGDPQTVRVADKIRPLLATAGGALLESLKNASNSLAISVMTPPYGAVFCHPESHIEVDECGAPGFFTGGAKLIHMDDENGLCTPAGFDAAWNHLGKSVHQVQPGAVSLTQTSEAGTLYNLETIRTIADAAHDRGLHVHMDGARFANATAALDCTAADMSWKAGVDVLSFGASKNGCFAAEAVVFFNRDLAKTFEFHRKRGGHLFSKMRFISAQLDAYLDNDLWLDNARHANAMAKRLADGLPGIPGATFRFPVDTNLMFLELPEQALDGLEADGFQFYRMADSKGPFIRLVTAFNTDPTDVDAFIASASRHAGAA